MASASPFTSAAAIAVAFVIVLITLIDAPYGSTEWGAWASVAAFLVVYFAYARRHLGTERMGHHLAISIAFAVVLAVGTSFEPAFATVQTFLYPFVWSTAPDLRSALLANLFIAVGIVVGYAVRTGPAGIAPGIAVATLSVGFSIALGLWITRIAENGAERGRLLDELQAAQGQLAAMHRDCNTCGRRHRPRDAAGPQSHRPAAGRGSAGSQNTA